MIKKLSILILTSVFVWAREKDNPPAACDGIYLRNKSFLGWKKDEKRRFLECINSECANGNIESCEYRDKYYLDDSKNELPDLYQETSQVKDKFLKLELKGSFERSKKPWNYIPFFNYPGLAIKQSLHDLKFENPEAKTMYEDLIDKIEGHEKQDYYDWWFPCRNPKKYEEHAAKCTGDLKEKFMKYDFKIRDVGNSPTEALIKSLRQHKNPIDKDLAQDTADVIGLITNPLSPMFIGNKWWLPCAMCQKPFEFRENFKKARLTF